MSRFSYKTDLKLNLALLTEVESLNPFSVPVMKAKSIWEIIASNLQSSDPTLTKVTHRNCRERIDQLLREFRQDENISFKSSGIAEPEMDGMKTLLTSVSKLQEMQKSLPAGMKKLYSKKARQQGEEIRRLALQQFEVEDAMPSNEETTPGNDENQPEATQTGPEPNPSNSSQQQLRSTSATSSTSPTPMKKPRLLKNAGQNMMVDFLKSKNENELDFRREELKIRATEAENRRMELQLQKQKQAAELETEKRLKELMFKILDKKLSETN